MDRAKTILVAASTFPRWENDSVPPFVFLLCRALSQKGKQIIVLAPHYPRAKFFEIIDGIKIYRFPYFFPTSLQKLCYDGGIPTNIQRSNLAKIQIPLFLIMEFFYISYLNIKFRPSIVHAHWILPQGMVAASARKIFGFNLVTTAHGSDVFSSQKGLSRSLVIFAVRASNIVTLNSSANSHTLTEIDGGQSRKIIIPMGIDVDKFSPHKRDNNLRSKLGVDGPFLLAVGRIVEQKGFNYVIHAMNDVIKEFPGTKLFIIGDGPEKGRLQQLAERLNLISYVIFLGPVPNDELPAYYASADVFIGPSIEMEDGATESFGVVFLEALASGVPVITTGVGGIGDIIQDDFTGIIVPEKNSEAIINATREILNNSGLRVKLANNGLKLVREKFSWDIISAEFSSLYNKVIIEK